jgi:DNA-binding protein H-NS
MKLDTLDALGDNDLRAVIAHAETLLKQHDRERKEKALGEARAALAAVGLTLKDLAKKSPAKTKGPVYHSGRQYQHPVNKTLVWPGKGKKPGWLVSLEAEGGNAVEMAAANDNVSPASLVQKVRNVG